MGVVMSAGVTVDCLVALPDGPMVGFAAGAEGVAVLRDVALNTPPGGLLALILASWSGLPADPGDRSVLVACQVPG